jgi:hypothetical protein
VILMLDETIITETPPLYSAYGRIGSQIKVPISGNRQKRILHGVINIFSGGIALFITEVWNSQTHMLFLKIIRKTWRGWNIIVFEDKGTPHTAKESLKYRRVSECFSDFTLYSNYALNISRLLVCVK